ncbi:MAG: hypothetical protein RLZZ479_1285 [Bacteroidota bacterium]|jgi:hypothetical protein
MDLNVDNIINLLKKLSYSNKVEFAEQDASADTSSSDTSTASSGTVKKWESGRVMGKTYGGPGYKWESGRTFGKTYMNDPKHKWYSGVQRGKANPASES